jgi:hypothetical protein
MSAAGIATRLARLERSIGSGGTCPQHDIAIGVRQVEDGVTTITREPASRACHRCGQPSSAFWIQLMIVPNRRRVILNP